MFFEMAEVFCSFKIMYLLLCDKSVLYERVLNYDNFVKKNTFESLQDMLCMIFNNLWV